jgi:hypothetical protein
MTTSIKLNAGDLFPEMQVTLLDGSSVTLGKPQGNATWQAVFVYRGKHCPLCTKYLNELESYKQKLLDSGVETDHNFSEPALFVINENGGLQIVDLSNNPFVRPELESLVNGIGWIRNPDNNYPIRGTFKY